LVAKRNPIFPPAPMSAILFMYQSPFCALNISIEQLYSS